MSIFTINYLYDISENDRSLLDVQQKSAKRLKRQAKANKEKYRSHRIQFLPEVGEEILKNRISIEENEFIKKALQSEQQQSVRQKTKPIIQMNQQNSIENISYDDTQRDFSIQRPAQMREKQKQSSRQQIYKSIIQSRYQRIQKIGPRDYFKTHLGI